MTKRLSLTEKLNRANARKGLKSQRDLFSDAARKTEQEVLSGSLSLRRHEPEELMHAPWGVLSGPMYERSWEPDWTLDESGPVDTPYVRPYFTHSEWTEYNHHMDQDQRGWFLLLVAISLKSDGL